jgi:putative phosphoesterase
MKMAVLSDIHGNRFALEEVLKSIKDREIKKMVNLGDSLYGPLDPAGTADILMKLSIPAICGNEDRLILEPHSSIKGSPSYDFVRSQLKQTHIEWLKSLPSFTAVDCLFYLCHGTPARDDEYPLEEAGEGGVSMRSEKDVSALVAEIELPVILCGHSHRPGHKQIQNGPLVINPGSVGLPAYFDEHPFPHKMETGSPHARYAIVEKKNSRWHIEDISVVYDWDLASKTAEKNGRSDWAYWLRTGHAK